MFGFGFGSMYHHFTKSNIDELINRENLMLEDILDDENILTDAKGNNEKFGKFLYRHPDFVKSLIDYIIKEPCENENDFRVCYKYPFISSEILGSEITGLIRAFFEDARDSDSFLSASRNFDQMSQDGKDGEHEESKERKESTGTEKRESLSKFEKEESKILPKPLFDFVGTDLLEYLMSFLENDEKYLNQTLCGYFQKAINAILNKRGNDFLSFMFERKDYITKLINHSINKSISEIIFRLLTIDIPMTDNKTVFFMNERKDLIDLIFDYLKTSDIYEEIENIALILCEIVNKNTNVNGGTEVMEFFNNAKYLEILYQKLSSQSSIISSSACSVLFSLMNFYMHKQTTLSDSTTISPIKDQNALNKPQEFLVLTDLDFETNIFFKVLLEKLPYLVKILMGEVELQEIQSTFGGTIKPFGSSKIKILELINLCMKIKTPISLIETLGKLNLFELLMDFSIKYEFNSFLHSITEKILVNAFESDSKPLLKSLVTTLKLQSLLMNGINKKDLTFSKPDRKIKRGYIAFYIKMSNYLVITSTRYQFLFDILKADTEWQKFVETELENINVIQSRDLGGYNPKKTGQQQPLEEEDNNKIEIDIKKIYEKFSQFFQNGPMKEKQDDQDNEVEDDYEKESPEYGSPEKNQGNLDVNDLQPNEDELEDNKIYEEEIPTETSNENIAEFLGNQFWKKPDLFNLEDILKDL